MCTLICKECKQEFKSLIIDKHKSSTQAMELLIKHVNAEHTEILTKTAIVIQKGVQLLAAIVFANAYIIVKENSPNAEWYAETLGQQQTELAMICGFEFEEEEEEEEEETGDEEEETEQQH